MITGNVPMGGTADRAPDGIRLVMLVCVCTKAHEIAVNSCFAGACYGSCHLLGSKDAIALKWVFVCYAFSSYLRICHEGYLAIYATRT